MSGHERAFDFGDSKQVIPQKDVTREHARVRIAAIAGAKINDVVIKKKRSTVRPEERFRSESEARILRLELIELEQRRKAVIGQLQAIKTKLDPGFFAYIWRRAEQPSRSAWVLEAKLPAHSFSALIDAARMTRATTDSFTRKERT